MTKLALQELGVLDEAVGDPPEIAFSVRMLFDAYWEMRAFSSYDEPLTMATVVAWLDANDMREALSDWMPFLSAMEAERRDWYAEELQRRIDERKKASAGMVPEAY